MGLRQAVGRTSICPSMLNAADTPEQREFMDIVKSHGLKAALAWRDAATARYWESVKA